MKVYVVKEAAEAAAEEKYVIIKVKPGQESSFVQEYAGRIVLEGDSIQEVLIKFNELQNRTTG